MWPFASSSSTAQPADESACPVDAQTRAAWLASNPQGAAGPSSAGPSSPGAAAVTPQQRRDFHALSTQREVSSIPRFSRAGAPDAGGSEPDESRNWVYPSPAQFFAAMARKQQDPQAPDMDIVVPIHNAVNERAWRQICDWEAGWDASAQARCGGPQLVSFKNRQTERTWRAWGRGLMG
jgi:cytochrome c heme-lyase